MRSEVLVVTALVSLLALTEAWRACGDSEAVVTALPIVALFGVITPALLCLWGLKSESARRNAELRERFDEIPFALKSSCSGAVFLGQDVELGSIIHLPRSIRLRHTHIIGATGSGKTEGVILNLLKQDVGQGCGAIILDAKGDVSFLSFLLGLVPSSRLKIFDLSDPACASYDPLKDGNALESAQRLFSSLTWSEEYYKSKALTALQRIYTSLGRDGKNPTLAQIAKSLESEAAFADTVATGNGYSNKNAQADYKDLSGLRDQVLSLTQGHLQKTLSPVDEPAIALEEAARGSVFYFRLQSLLSRQLSATVGRLIINHLSYIAGQAHRSSDSSGGIFIPTFLDEFGTFACAEFADLISKARSAGMALHFSHQSAGDLEGVQDGFMSQILDNTATKIVLRINDPNTAEIFSRTFGTTNIQKFTKRVTNADRAEVAEDGTGSMREARAFRAAPDLLKTLPTGYGAALIAHGEATPHGASTVFKLKFPRL